VRERGREREGEIELSRAGVSRETRGERVTERGGQEGEGQREVMNTGHKIERERDGEREN
jgi:hypothetical protein